MSTGNSPRMTRSAVESSVTRLLMTTRQLLQALSDWSFRRCNDEAVSDIYVKLGNDLSGFTAAFAGYDVDFEAHCRLVSVPEQLRPLLEHCLAQEQSPETVEIYVNDIRAVLARVWQGTKYGQNVIKRQRSESEARAQEQQYRHGQQQLQQQQQQQQAGPSRTLGPDQNAGPSRRTSDRTIKSIQSVGDTSRSSAYSVESNSHRVQLVDLGAGDRSTSRATSPSSTQDGRPMGPRQAGSAGYSSRVNARVGAPLPPAPPDAFRPPRRSPSPTPSYQRPDEPPVTRFSDTRIVSSGPDRPAKSAARERPTSPADPVVPSPVTPPRRTVNMPASMADTPPHLASRFSLDSEIDPTDSTRQSLRDSRRGSRMTSPPPAPILTTPPQIPEVNRGLASPIGDVSVSSQQTLATPDAPPTPAALASLTALQNSEALGRRASRRFSQYQIKQMLPNHNKGPSSSSLRHPRLESLTEGGMFSPQRPARRVAPPLPPIPDTYTQQNVVQQGHARIPNTITESRRSSGTIPEPGEVSVPEVSITESSPVQPPRRERPSSMIINPDEEIVERGPEVQEQQVSVAPVEEDQPPDSAAPFKVFLQFGRETKRVTLDRETVTSIVDLQGLFMSKFDYAPEGMELFPDVYIKDPISGIAYHLEDLEDIKRDALLSLNLDPLDQVKQHFDNTITSLSHEIKDLKNSFMHSRRASALKLEVPLAGTVSPSLRASDRGRETSPVPPVRLTVSAETTPVGAPKPLPDIEGEKPTHASLGRIDLQNQQHDIQVLRRELGTMRQVYLDFVGQTKQTFQTVRDQTLAVREVALTKLSGSRSLVDAAKISLEKHSSETVQAVEDISDTVDQIKEDVLKRQIMPRGTQMSSMQDDLTKAQKQVEQLRGQITLAAPSWKQTWNQELKNVVEEQHLLQHQEKLTADLEDDIKQALEIFDTLREYVNQRQAGARPAAGPRKLRSVPMPEDDGKPRVSDLLLEIRTKDSDPNRRLAAIEQQQRQREKDKADKNDEFTDELSGFVAGRKLKKTGGTEEAERIRQRKQEMNFKRMFSNETVRDGASSGASTPTVASGQTLAAGRSKAEEGESKAAGEQSAGENAVGEKDASKGDE